jgi:hypothetical protein
MRMEQTECSEMLAFRRWDITQKKAYIMFMAYLKAMPCICNFMQHAAANRILLTEGCAYVRIVVSIVVVIVVVVIIIIIIIIISSSSSSGSSFTFVSETPYN